MISFDYVRAGQNYYRACILDAPGDEVIVRTQWPLLGVKSITDFYINSFNSNCDYYFRYSKDSLVWTEFIPLTVLNLRSVIDLKEKHPCQIEFKIVNSKSTSIIYWIDIIFDYIEGVKKLYNPVQQEFIDDQTAGIDDPESYQYLSLAQFLPYKHRQTLLWAVNVLNKMFWPGIVASFVERYRNDNWQDEDYINFFWNFIYILAQRVSYNNIFREIVYRPELLGDFLKQRDLFPGYVKDLGSFYYFATNYYNEMRNRGTVKIFDQKYNLPENFIKREEPQYQMYNPTQFKKDKYFEMSYIDEEVAEFPSTVREVYPEGETVEVRGELLRWLNVDSEEINKFILVGSDIGWYVGLTSPFYMGAPIDNFILGYGEKTVTDKSKLPLIIGFLSYENYYVYELLPQEDDYFGVPNLWGVYFSMFSSSLAGIGGTDESKIIPVNVNFSYEITFYVKKDLGYNLSFAVKCFNKYGQYIDQGTSLSAEFQYSEYFFKEQNLPSDNKYYFVKGVIYSIDYQYKRSTLNVGFGHNLKFINKEVAGIIPQVTFISDNGKAKEIRLIDIKVRFANVNTAEYLSQDNTLHLRYKNCNPELSDAQVIPFIDNKLLPYDMSLYAESKDPVV